jgi:hypothetical protein
MLVIAYKLNAKGLWEFTFDEFVLGFSRFGYRLSSRTCSLSLLALLYASIMWPCVR